MFNPHLGTYFYWNVTYRPLVNTELPAGGGVVCVRVLDDNI